MAKIKNATAQALDQFTRGEDFVSPKTMLGDLSPDLATKVPKGSPYSIATLVAHMHFWQSRWLARILNEPLEKKKGKHGDFPKVAPAEWNRVRRNFLNGLKTANEIAKDEAGLQRELPNGGRVQGTLTAVAVHNSYHLGEIALLRQLLCSWPPKGSSDAW
jgi:uncharacterized damage-inducible protein DinB